MKKTIKVIIVVFIYYILLSIFLLSLRDYDGCVVWAKSNYVCDPKHDWVKVLREKLENCTCQ